jgi:hypothetical protein
MMLPSEVTETVFAQSFRRATKEFAAVTGTGAESNHVERLEVREVGECAVEAWSPDGRDFLTEFWLDETFFQLGVIQPTIVPEANGVWRAAW